MTEKAHAKLAPSASKRWLACPGSIALCEKVPPPKDSPYAAEGTAAHMLGELCLTKKKNALDFKGMKFSLPGGNFTATEDMCEHVQVYVDDVRGAAFDNVLNVEKKFDLSWIHPGMFGSNDASVYDPATKRLSVFDLKFGMGVVVEPEWNSQLMVYALGAMRGVWEAESEKSRAKFSVLDLVTDVNLTIVQPRAYHPEGSIRSWTVTASELLFWALHVLKPGAEATTKPNAPLCAGEHCRFCPAIAVCPEQIKQACVAAKTEFSDPVLPAPDAMTPEQVAKVMEVSERFANWASEVRAYAHTLAERGVKLPGFKLVARRSDRKWTDEETAAGALEQHLNDGAYTRKLLSVAQAEKALKKLGVSPEAALDGLWEKPDNGTTLVSDEDRRAEKPAGNSAAALEFLDDLDFLG